MSPLEGAVDCRQPLGALIIPKQRTGKTLIRIVKLTGIFLLAAMLQVSARSNAQRLSISVRNGSLEKVFSEIEKKTNYVLFYDATLLQKSKPVTVEMKDASVEEVLNASLKDQGLGFSIQDRTIFLKREMEKTPPVVAPSVVMDEGDETIDIIVESESGEPLSGASVNITKLKKSGMTDFKGRYSLKGMKVPDGEYAVEITNVGFEKHVGTLKVVNGRAKLGVRMKQATSGLNETVVKGYYATSKALNTGNVSTVSGDIIHEQPVSDPIQALIGRVPGLVIQQSSGNPGAYAKIMVRGQNSISNGNDPLYVVDGVPFSSLSLSSTSASIGVTGLGNALMNTGSGLSPFNGLNPTDIESIDVLKDADATAIYGSRGANGVILITTKKGKSGDTKFDLNVFTGAGSVARKVDLLNTQQYLAMRREAFLNDKLAIPSIITKPTDVNYDINGVWDTTRYTDWQKVLLGGTENFTNAQGSISAGNVNTRFTLGGGYARQGTVFPGDYADQKASVHVNISHNSVDRRLGVQFVTNYINDNNNIPANNFPSSITLAPDAPPLYDKQGNINWATRNGTATFANPLASLAIKASAVTNNLISNLKINYELLKGLQLRVSLGYNHDEMRQSSLTPAVAFAPPNNNLNTNRDNTFATTDFSSWIVEPGLNFSKSVGYGRLDITAGLTYQQNKSNSFTQDTYNFVSDALISNPQAASNLKILGINDVLYRYTAAYGRISYDWQDKYVVNLTARRDGSSRFGPGKQFGNFGAAGLAWIFSKESFVHDHFHFLNFGKIRGSYGVTGNDQIADYQYLSTYSATTNTYQGITGLAPVRLTNPFFAWEVVKKLEGGIEMGFLKDKLSDESSRIFISASYYRNRTANQLVGLSLPSQTGFTTIQYNLPAIVQNTGFEVLVNTENIHSNAFEWSSSINLTIPSNKLVAFPNLANFAAYKNTYIVGESIFIKRTFQNTGVNPQTGLYSFNTKNTTGLPSSPQDYAATSLLTQRFYGGIQNRFSYKNFGLDIFFQFVKQLGSNYIIGFGPYAGIANTNQPTEVLGRWRNPGDLTATQRFGTTSGSTIQPAQFLAASNKQYVDASFIRLKNLAFSYQMPRAWTSKLQLQNVKIYVQCQNLFTITHYVGLDPESGVLALPPLRMLAAGFQVGL